MEPCPKNESEDNVKAKGIRTVESYLCTDLEQIYTDGSSDKIILKGGAGIHTTLLDDTTSLTSYGEENIASNFSFDLIAIQETFREYINLNDAEQSKMTCNPLRLLRQFYRVV
ncbi:hypothetical protein NPIL_218541 [Nephila pilipes]|uniref:Uncharacterized protein n=1 Tax=Nephila pilipes TaxID=299642 RepID=A0A8X6I858_NEPPI|nr:hypothetical protein NPIL_218541 [Nephila pilipes]